MGILYFIHVEISINDLLVNSNQYYTCHTMSGHGWYYIVFVVSLMKRKKKLFLAITIIFSCWYNWIQMMDCDIERWGPSRPMSSFIEMYTLRWIYVMTVKTCFFCCSVAQVQNNKNARYCDRRVLSLCFDYLITSTDVTKKIYFNMQM